jgi:hypothetical protein
MTDDQVLGMVLRRFLTAITRGDYGTEFFIVNQGELVLDGTVDISDAEREVIRRVVYND